MRILEVNYNLYFLFIIEFRDERIRNLTEQFATKIRGNENSRKRMFFSTNMNFSYSSNIRNFNELKNFPDLLDNTYNILKLKYLNYLN